MNTVWHPRMPRWASAVAIALCAAALVMGPVIFFGGFALRTTLLDLNGRIDQERTRSADLTATLLAQSMAGRADLVELFSARAMVRTALAAGDAAALDGQLAELAAGRPDVTSTAALDARGILVARYPADPSIIGRDFSTRDYFTGATGADGPFVSEAFVSAAQNGSAVVAVAAAVRDGRTTLGVVLMTLQPAVLVDALKIAEQGGREVLVLDRSSRVVTSTAGRAPLTQLSLAPRPSPTAMTIDVDGQPRTYVSAPVPGAAWTLYVLDDAAVVYAQQRDLVRQIGLPLASTLLAAALLAVLLAVGYLLLRRERDRLANVNTRLVAANAAVEAATRAKSDFLASMSHELRTPLNAVLGFSDVLLEQLGPTLSDRQRRYLDNIHAAGSHLLELINDVLDLAKVEAGRLVLRAEPIPLTDLLEPVVASAAQLAADRGVRLDVLPFPAGIAFVDAARLRQVLLNLLSNAVKFTPSDGRVGLHVSARDRALCLEVTDTGIGIAAEHRDRVFGMFERLHEGRSDAAGSGLGLAITKKLVELHNGTIDFESEPGQGTRFLVTIPDAIVEPATGPRVLVVEDDNRDAELLAELVREAGERVEVAPTAAIALAAIARSAPSAVILDLRLPDRRGDDVLVALKSDPRSAGIPVLVVTVEDDDGGARLLGADDHMTKPIETERVRAWLRRAVAGGVARARAAG